MRQRQQHEEENHVIFRNWCAVCIAGRGIGGQHRRKRKLRAEELAEGPMICSDFSYMSTDEAGSMPMLAIKSTRSGRVSATALESKGVTAHAARFFAEVMVRTGLRKFSNFSDNESSLLLLKAAAARSVKGAEAVPKECQFVDHSANCHAESTVRQVKDQMRTIRIGLERRLGKMFWMRQTLSWLGYRPLQQMQFQSFGR